MLTLANRLMAPELEPRTVSFVSATAHTDYSDTITMPTLQAGDLIVVAQYLQATANTSGTFTKNGTGFATITGGGTGSTERTHQRLSMKVAESSDSGASIDGFLTIDDPAWYTKAWVFVYRPSRPLSAISQVTVLHSSRTSAVTGPIAAATYDASLQTDTLVYIVCAGSKGQTLAELSVSGFTATDQATVNTTSVADLAMRCTHTNTPSSGYSISYENTDSTTSNYPSRFGVVLRIKR